MLMIALLFSVVPALYSLEGNGAVKTIYCKNFYLSKIYHKGQAYQNCSQESEAFKSSYYKIMLYKGRVIRAAFYNSDGELKTIEAFDEYASRRGVRRRHTTVYQSGSTYYYTHTFYRGLTERRRLGIKSRIEAQNGDTYYITYTKKIEKYENNLLTMASYYFAHPFKKQDYRLLMKLYYDKQRISGYKYRRYLGNLVVEKEVDGMREQVTLYKLYEGIFEQPELTFYRSQDDPGFFLSVYYYDSNDKHGKLILKEDYYALDRNVKQFFNVAVRTKRYSSRIIRSPFLRRVELMRVKDRKVLSMGYTLYKRRYLWSKLFEPYGVTDAKHRIVRKSVWRKAVWHYKSSDKKEITQSDESVLRNEPLHHVEYYKDDIVRKVVFYHPNGSIKKTEYYNHKGVRLFDKD